MSVSVVPSSEVDNVVELDPVVWKILPGSAAALHMREKVEVRRPRISLAVSRHFSYLAAGLDPAEGRPFGRGFLAPITTGASSPFTSSIWWLCFGCMRS